MIQKQPKTDRQSDPRNRLYKMITKAKPEILWQAESLRQRWDRKRLERRLTKEIRVRLAYHWQRYIELDALQRQALDDYITIQERKIKLEDLLWEKGYRHGDYVLVYEPVDGAFKMRVMTKFDFRFLMLPNMVAGYEEVQGNRVRPEERTQRKSQPDLTCHETGWLIKGFNLP
jgi:hypothetical protein